jgi:butyryl-CoA dehydrogenase
MQTGGAKRRVKNRVATAMTRVYLMGAMEGVESAAKAVLAAANDGDVLRTQMAILRRLSK